VFGQIAKALSDHRMLHDFLHPAVPDIVTPFRAGRSARGLIDLGVKDAQATDQGGYLSFAFLGDRKPEHDNAQDCSAEQDQEKMSASTQDQQHGESKDGGGDSRAISSKNNHGNAKQA
jgi:hypothetical protein